MGYILDTNIIFYLLKNNQTVKQSLKNVEFLGEKIFISCITVYEIKRGLIAVNAVKQLADFNKLCQDYQLLFLDTSEIIDRAAEIHADLKIRGLPIQTEDILIAASALAGGLIVVSNDSDLLRVKELIVENWLL